MQALLQHSPETWSAHPGKLVIAIGNMPIFRLLGRLNYCQLPPPKYNAKDAIKPGSQSIHYLTGCKQARNLDYSSSICGEVKDKVEDKELC
jgi:hypothetical protein